MQTTPIDRKQRSRHRTTGHCLQTIQAKSSETSFISIDISFLLGFSSFLMSFLLPVDLSPDGCIDPRMCVTDYKENSKKFWSFIKSKGQEWTGVAPVKNKMGFLQRMCMSPLCHFRRYSFINGVLDCVFQSVPK
jgi:hypothetical protein